MKVVKVLAGALVALASFFPVSAPAQTPAPVWEEFAKESEAFLVAYDVTVRYGADTRWFTKTYNSWLFASGFCIASEFGGDPAPGTVKTCQYDKVNKPGWDCLPGLPPYYAEIRKFRATTPEPATGYGWWCVRVTNHKTLQAKWQDNYLLVPDKYLNYSKFSEAALKVANAVAAFSATAASSPMLVAKQAMAEVEVTPTPGSYEEYMRKLLWYRTCQELVKPPMPAASWVWNTTTPCGDEPTPPPASAEVWWVMKASSAANPPGTRPTYRWGSNNSPVLECSTCRVPEYSICTMDDPKKTYLGTYYGRVLDSANRYAVCVRKP